MGLFDWFKGRNVLYVPGCMAIKYKGKTEAYKKIFSKLGIKFIDLDDVGLSNICCGLEAWEAGYDVEARKLVRRNADLIAKEGFDGIITTSPGCYKMFLKDYPEILPDWSIEIKNVWDLVLERLLKKHRLIKEKALDFITFHDNCYLGRNCGIYSRPRRILEVIGYEIKEMDNSRENSFCCGSCGGLIFSNPDLANKIAKERILQAKRIGVKKMVVIGFENYDLLKKNVGNSGIEVLEFSDVLASALGIDLTDRFDDEPIEGEEKILEMNEVSEKRVLTETKANMRLREELKEEDYYDGIKDGYF